MAVPRPRVCAVVHSGADPEGTLGWLAGDLRARGSLSTVVMGEQELPPPEDVDLLVVMGSAASAYDDTVPWLAAEVDYVREAVATTAVLGICFGAQVMARALGGTVRQAAASEIGWHEVDTADPDAVPPGPWFEYHHDVFTVPPGAVELARTSTGPQAFRVGRSLAVQFHPEMSPAALDAWKASWSAASASPSGDAGAGDPAGPHPLDEFRPELRARAVVAEHRCRRLLDHVWEEVAGLGSPARADS